MKLIEDATLNNDLYVDQLFCDTGENYWYEAKNFILQRVKKKHAKPWKDLFNFCRPSFDGLIKDRLENLTNWEYGHYKWVGIK